MLEELFEKNVLTTPWPIYVGSRFFEGSKITKSEVCNLSCIEKLESGIPRMCGHGLSHISTDIDGVILIVSGVYLSNAQDSKKSNKKYKLKKASIIHIHRWILDVESKNKAINKISDKIARSKFDQFHEFAKWANEINFYSTRLIEKAKINQDVGFNSASEDLKSLYKTSVMLSDSLDTSSIYFNPSSASFGNKRSTDIYSMAHKISLVLSHSRSNKNKVKISIQGRVKNKHRVYESFKIILLSFIQNAVKYRKSKNIEIFFEEEDHYLKMDVVSYGDFIPEDELKKLFDRGYRASSILLQKIEGNGLGLYVAKIVADAHNFELTAKSLLDDQDFAKNIFTVKMH